MRQPADISMQAGPHMHHVVQLVGSTGCGVNGIHILECSVCSTLVRLALAHAGVDHAVLLVLAAELGRQACVRTGSGSCLVEVLGDIQSCSLADEVLHKCYCC